MGSRGLVSQTPYNRHLLLILKAGSDKSDCTRNMRNSCTTGISDKRFVGSTNKYSNVWGHTYIKTFFMLYFKFKFDWKSCVTFGDLNFQGLERQELSYR